MSESMSPRKIEMMAGGASLAPRRWSLAALATQARSRSACRSTARMTARRKTRNCMLVWVVVRGSSRLTPVSVDIDQLLCLPEPLMPANGFSCSSAASPCSLGHPLERLHEEHLVVGGEVGVLEDRGDLVLARRHLVVAGLDRDAEAVQLALGVGHERQHARGDRAEVVVLELLALGRPAPKSVRSQVIRSGRWKKSSRSIRKYSCSGPTVVMTRGSRRRRCRRA